MAGHAVTKRYTPEELLRQLADWQSRAEAAEQKLERLRGIASDMVEYAGSGRRIGQHILKILDEDNQGGASR